MKFLFISVFLWLQTLFLPLKAEERKDIRWRLERPIAGMQYRVYQDEQCHEPYQNENGEDIVLKTDEKGFLQGIDKLPSIYWLQQIYAAKGYFLDANIYSSKNPGVLSVDRIIPDFSLQKVENGHLFLYEDGNEEAIADWYEKEGNSPRKDGKEVLLEVGHSYVLKAETKEEYERIPEIHFEIPKYRSVLRKVLKKTICGKVAVRSLETNTGFPVENTRFVFYKDIDCKEPLLGYDGQEVVLTTGEDGKAIVALPKGKYYCRNEITKKQYYADSKTYCIEVANRETTLLSVEAVPVTRIFRLQENGSGKEIKGDLWLESKEGKKKIQAGQEVSLLRQEQYRISCVESHAGYYDPEEVHMQISDEMPSSKEVILSYMPFSIQFLLKEKGTGKSLENCMYAMVDENGNVIGNFVTEKEPVTLPPCLPAHTYQLRPISVPETYHTPQEVTCSIPALGEALIHLEDQVETHVNVLFQVQDTKTQEQVPSSLTIYQDEEGTKVAEDIYGNRLENLSLEHEHISLPNGKWYFQIHIESSAYYQNDRMYSFTTNYSQKTKIKLTVAMERAEAEIGVYDNEGNDIPHVTMLIQNKESGEKKKVIYEKKTTLSKLGIPIETGTTYMISLLDMEGQYRFTDRPYSLTIPTTAPAEPLQTKIEVHPYTVLSLIEKEPQKSVYALFKDPQCTKKAKDVDSHPTEQESGKQGKVIWHLKDGKYWLKQIRTSPQFYVDSKVTEFVVNHHKKNKMEYIQEVYPVSLWIEPKDRWGRALEDGEYVIEDSEGNVLQLLQGKKKYHLEQESWLQCGKEFHIKETRAPKGYHSIPDLIFTVAKTRPSSEPVITLKYTSRNYPNRTEGSSDKRQDLMQYPFAVPLGILVGVLGIGIGIWIFQKKKLKKIN